MSEAIPPSKQDEIQVAESDPAAPYYDDRGNLFVPPPIPGLSKPVGLAYKNYNAHFKEHVFKEKLSVRRTRAGEKEFPRALVGSSLVSPLLRHYFSSSEYTVQLVWPGHTVIKDDEENWVEDALVFNTPVDGTRHYAVTKKSEDSSAQEMVALVVVVTDPKFFELAQRKKPSRLGVVKKYVDSRGELVVNDLRMSRGTVVILGGVSSPVQPTWEFYKFDSSSAIPGQLAPRVDLISNEKGEPTNSVSLWTKDAHWPTAMFKQIVREAAEKYVAPAKTPKKRLTPEPRKRKAEITPESETPKRTKTDNQAKSSAAKQTVPAAPVEKYVPNPETSEPKRLTRAARQREQNPSALVSIPPQYRNRGRKADVPSSPVSSASPTPAATPQPKQAEFYIQQIGSNHTDHKQAEPKQSEENQAKPTVTIIVSVTPIPVSEAIPEPSPAVPRKYPTITYYLNQPELQNGRNTTQASGSGDNEAQDPGEQYLAFAMTGKKLEGVNYAIVRR